MTLDKWLTAAKDAKGMTEEQFGASVGISQAQVNRLRNGKGPPSAGLIARIRDATDGMVTPNDWFPPAKAGAKEEAATV